MDLVTVRELYKNPEKFLDKEITVGGWIRSLRDSKAFGFIVISDGTYFETLQAVYHDTLENFAQVSKLGVGTAIIVKGTLVATPQNSLLRSSLLRLLLKVHLHLITRCRKSATLLNICAPSHIYVQGPTLSRQYSVCVL